jgi:hypothetical protein
VNQTIMGVVDLGWLIAHSLVGPLPLTLALVGTSALLLNGVRVQGTGRDVASATFHAGVGLLTIPVFGVLLFLWSIALDLSFTSSVLAWSAVLASGHGCVRLATKRQHTSVKPTPALRLAA